MAGLQGSEGGRIDSITLHNPSAIEVDGTFSNSLGVIPNLVDDEFQILQALARRSNI